VLAVHGPSPLCPVGPDVQRSLTAVERSVAAAVEAELARTTVRDLVPAVPLPARRPTG